MSTKKYVIFARVSSREQETEGHSLEGQVKELTAWVGRHGGAVARTFKVQETATRSGERAIFREMLQYVRQHHSDIAAVLVYKLDRAARNMNDYVELERIEADLGVALIATSQETQNNPSGRMARRMMAATAAFYTEQQAMDIAQGIRRRVEAGFPIGLAPYGYRNERQDGRRVVQPDPEMAPRVRRIFELYAFHGHTLESLINALREEGVPYSPRKQSFNKTKLYTILTSRAYIGEVLWHGQWHPGSFEPLVERRVFNSVQERLRGGSRQAHELVYAGKLITCSHCGGHLTGEEIVKNRGTSKERRYHYYRCSQLRNVPSHDKGWRFSEASIDAQVFALFEEMKVDDDEVRKWFIDLIREKTRTAHDQERVRLADARRRQTTLEERRRRLIAMRMDNEIDADAFAEQSLVLRDELSAVKLQLESESRSADEDAEQAVNCFELSQALKAKWLTATVQARRQMLGFIASNYRMDGSTLVATKRSPFSLLGKTAISCDGGGGGRGLQDLRATEGSGETLYQPLQVIPYPSTNHDQVLINASVTPLRAYT